ncbi:MAG: S41 family peptidase [bacterium]
MNKRGKMVLAAVLLAVLVSMIALLALYGPRFGIYLIKPRPQAYGEMALDFMENGYYTDTERWQEAKKTARDAISGARSYEETWPHLREALKVAGGKHSRLLTPAEAEEEQEEAFELPRVSTDRMERGILTLALPSFTRGAAEAQEYAQIVLSWLSGHRDCAGVILDLRGNRGGDLAPMIAALSPLLPDGEVLAAELASGERVGMTLTEGAFSGGSGIQVESFKMPEQIPIAILTDEWTASSGEAVLLSFRGLEQVRSFGAPTAGYASVNTVLRLYDGAQVVLTIGADYVPRTGERFCDDPIAPDVLTDKPEEEAAQWIRGLAS